MKSNSVYNFKGDDTPYKVSKSGNFSFNLQQITHTWHTISKFAIFYVLQASHAWATPLLSVTIEFT